MLEIQNLSCQRSGRVIFRGLHFTLKTGGFMLVTGRNGSGKSSLLRLLAGLLPQKEGIIYWGGIDVAHDLKAHHKRLHYIGHLDALKPELKVSEMIGYWGVLSGVEVPSLQAILDHFSLQELAGTFIRHLSAGQKRRLSLSRLFLTSSPLWLLDEPATMMDEEGRTLLDRHIENHRKKGGIVIAASHDMPKAGAEHLALEKFG